ncbi:hypothetical protein NLX62_02455 [Mycobacteriaceae bacterium Msp059]|nr:hypothetical protein [Mycobacteriaceae bacterium Msp059]
MAHEPSNLQGWPSCRDAQAGVHVAERVELQLGAAAKAVAWRRAGLPVAGFDSRLARSEVVVASGVADPLTRSQQLP